MNPPEMMGWNLALRFGLELAALAGLASAAWKFTSGPVRWLAVIAVPVTAAIVWGVFNVLDDPSRSGSAPIQVTGRTRLVIELSILSAGSIALAVATRPSIAVGLSTLVAAHYASSWDRIQWLVEA